MSGDGNSLLDLIDLIQKKEPERLNLIRATDQAQFESAFDGLLEQAVMTLESNKKNFSGLDEVGLSAVLAASMTGFGLAVSQETHSNGHVDLTFNGIYCNPSRKIIGEAKIYKGPEYHISGIEQLLGKYTTGRECRAQLIVYFRTPKIENLVKKIRDRMDKDRPCGQVGPTVNHNLKWSFLSSHQIHTGGQHEVGHIGCNLYFD
jgi:hypothetical protein